MQPCVRRSRPLWDNAERTEPGPGVAVFRKIAAYAGQRGDLADTAEGVQSDLEQARGL